MTIEKIYYDEFGKPYVLDEVGNKRPPMQLPEATNKSTTSSGWDTYDTSQGHCAFCGRLGCQQFCIQGG